MSRDAFIRCQCGATTRRWAACVNESGGLCCYVCKANDKEIAGMRAEPLLTPTKFEKLMGIVE